MSTEPPGAVSIAEFFNEVAELYEGFSGTLDSEGSPLRSWMAAQLPPGRRALDLGCGTGRHTVALAERYEEVLGADAAPNMIEIAQRERSRPNITYQVRDALAMTPAEDGVFDVVFCFSILFFLGETRDVLAHVSRLVAPGGVLVVIESERPADFGEKDWQVNFAFQLARMAYDQSGRFENSADILRLFANPNWVPFTEQGNPLDGAGFRREYSAALPGVTFTRDLVPGTIAARWQRPAAEAAQQTGKDTEES